jgi:leader peptidase (prepilin peptidase)/N-methyltransferase
MFLPVAFEIAAFLVGLLMGSFLNVCISRLPWHKSVVKPRSMCLSCRKQIRWYDNVPVLSWVLLRAKCRDCGATISWRYPAVEITVGVWFAFVASRAIALVNANGWVDSQNRSSYVFLDSVGLVGIAILGFLLIGLVVMDWQTHKLPDAFTFVGMFAGFLLVCVQAAFLPSGMDDIKLNPQHSLRMSSPGSFVAKGNVFMTGPEHLVMGRVLAMVGAACIILLIRWLYKVVRGHEGLGLGDAKLMAMIAAFLGFWPAVLALLLGVVSCAGYAVVLMVRGRATAATKLPLGTFIALGGLVTAVVGVPLISWYSSLL